MFSEGQGRGCTFTVELPAIVTDGVALVSSPAPPPAEQAIEAAMLSSPVVNNSLLRSISLHVSGSRHNIASVVPVNINTDGVMEEKSSHANLTNTHKSLPRILLVDDSAISRKMVRRAIQDNYASIVEAEDGEVAVAMVKEAMSGQTDPIDVILMDYQMPNMDGPTATKLMRTLGFSGPILGLTGNALPEDIATFTNHGANVVLTKPLNIELLESTVRGKIYCVIVLLSNHPIFLYFYCILFRFIIQIADSITINVRFVLTRVFYHSGLLREP